MEVLIWKRINYYFESNHRYVSFVWGCCLVLVISCLDAQIHPKISLSIFYLFPVSLVTWFVSREAGFIASGLSSVAGFVTKFRSDTLTSGVLIPFWNATVMLIVFLTVSSLLLKLREIKQEQIAQTDSLTGVANKRLFLELAGMEVKKVNRYRHPLTVVNLDVDDFKLFNQSLGRKLGDQLLYKAAQSLKNSIRETDLIGRICEDEFSIILPGIGYELAHLVICRLRNDLLETMESNQWSVTFSIAAVTFVNPPISMEEMLHQADHLMYLVKNNGKNQLKHKTAMLT